MHIPNQTRKAKLGGSGNLKNTVTGHFPNTVKKLWDKWNIRFAVLMSLFFQIVLIFLGKSRKRTGHSIVIAIIWSVYLLADWLAANAVGLISKVQTDDRPKEFQVDPAIAGFWAPFLLVHLGGRIPSPLSLLKIISYGSGIFLSLSSSFFLLFMSSCSLPPNELWIPTVIVYFAGTIKYGERMPAMYKACLSNFKRWTLPKPNPGPIYALLMEEYSAMKDSGIPVGIETVKETERGSCNSDLPIEDFGIPSKEEDLGDIDAAAWIPALSNF